jgi:hypothetical protein
MTYTVTLDDFKTLKSRAELRKLWLAIVGLTEAEADEITERKCKYISKLCGVQKNLPYGWSENGWARCDDGFMHFLAKGRSMCGKYKNRTFYKDQDDWDKEEECIECKVKS